MTVLLLGGTEEGRVIAERLTAMGIDVLTSLAGAVRAPKLPTGRVRIGGFGGEAGFRDVLTRESVRAIVDATHPFAAQITTRSHAIALADGLPFLRVERPGWAAGPGDNWAEIATLADAAALIAPGSRVFLATGRQSLEEAAAISHALLILRVIDPPEAPFPYPGGKFVIGRPPFTQASEQALFEAEGITHVIAKNAGGVLATTKLAAARTLGLPVLMLRRPGGVAGPLVDSVEAAVDWVRATLVSRGGL